MSISESLKNSVMAKITVISFLSLMLLIPLSMVDSMIREREDRRNKAVQEVSQKWGMSQQILGPVLVVPYKYYFTDKNKIRRVQISNAYFLPESLDVKSGIEAQKRYRGIFDMVLYDVDFHLSGHFVLPDFRSLKITANQVLWEDAFITIGIPDTRGIKGAVTMKWNKRTVQFHPGTNNCKLFDTGIHAQLPELKRNVKGRYHFDMNLKLQGSSQVGFSPVGKETNVSVTSNWTEPSFWGSYLPTKRKIDDTGFSASWKLSYFGRNYPQQWLEKDSGTGFLQSSLFGVSLILPVDFYQKCMRAVKYALLFIALTFLSVFLFEVLNRLQVHPIQYILVGLAMCIFYLLFLSLSEHIGFHFAYILSSIAVIAMITGYCKMILQKRSSSLIIAGLITVLYGYLYILLQSQDYALLLGSSALFIILGTAMYLTRNIDWYSLKLGTDKISE